MRLIDNKKDISYNKVRNRIYWKLFNSRRSDDNIWDKQDMDIHRLITSNNLMDSIHDEINRE
jgi:hypothetical protein